MKFYPTSETAKNEILEYAKEILTEMDAKKILEDKGFFVDNLWHINDIKCNYKCSKDIAQQVLYNALTNEYVIQAIWDSIDYFAEDMNLKRK
jgi:hypothetical protein